MNNTVVFKISSMLILTMLLASACTQTYSQAPLSTPTLISTGLFVSPFPSGQDPLQIVAELGTQTAVAKTAQVSGTILPTATGTPPTATNTTMFITSTPSTGSSGNTTTPAPVTVVPATKSPTPQVTAAVPTTSVGRPATYTVQQGEYPYCLARRFNVNPDDLLSANGLTSGELVYPGLTLTIPQTGSFPGERELHSHPDTYTVDSADTTVYSVACYYGDVLPQNIASASGISVSSGLTIGQNLTIP